MARSRSCTFEWLCASAAPPGTAPTATATCCCFADISGAVPASLQEMRQLMQLDLEINKLTGSLDQGQLCPDDNSLKLLLIRWVWPPLVTRSHGYGQPAGLQKSGGAVEGVYTHAVQSLSAAGGRL